MIELVKLMKDDPIWGCLALLFLFILYIWREHGKLRTELTSTKDVLEDKKLDKEDHISYAESHKELHEENARLSKMIVDLIKEMARK